MKFRIAAVAAATLVLAACRSADDASTEAEADTVEMPADSALEGVEATPVADPSANATAAATATASATPTVTEEEQIQQSGDDAAMTAGAAMDAMEEEGTN